MAAVMSRYMQSQLPNYPSSTADLTSILPATSVAYNCDSRWRRRRRSIREGMSGSDPLIYEEGSNNSRKYTMLDDTYALSGSKVPNALAAQDLRMALSTHDVQKDP